MGDVGVVIDGYLGADNGFSTEHGGVNRDTSCNISAATNPHTPECRENATPASGGPQIEGGIAQGAICSDVYVFFDDHTGVHDRKRTNNSARLDCHPERRNASPFVYGSRGMNDRRNALEATLMGGTAFQVYLSMGAIGIITNRNGQPFVQLRGQCGRGQNGCNV